MPPRTPTRRDLRVDPLAPDLLVRADSKGITQRTVRAESMFLPARACYDAETKRLDASFFARSFHAAQGLVLQVIERPARLFVSIRVSPLGTVFKCARNSRIPLLLMLTL